MKRILAVLACASALVLGVCACGRAPGAVPARARVRVAAAADLNAALGDLVTRFTASRDVDVTVTYGSSGAFYAQLLNGAPFDLFLSADIDYPKRLAAGGLTSRDGDFAYAVGRIVVWAPKTSAIDVGRGLAGLTDRSVAHVAIANPDHAPYGRAAVAAMQHEGVYGALQPKLVYGENVAQTMQFAQSGAADVGIVALSLALAPAARDGGRFSEIAQDEYPRIEQGGAILKWAVDVDAARAFRDFLTGPDGRAILKQYGFSAAGE